MNLTKAFRHLILAELAAVNAPAELTDNLRFEDVPDVLQTVRVSYSRDGETSQKMVSLADYEFYKRGEAFEAGSPDPAHEKNSQAAQRLIRELFPEINLNPEKAKLILPFYLKNQLFQWLGVAVLVGVVGGLLKMPKDILFSAQAFFASFILILRWEEKNYAGGSGLAFGFFMGLVALLAEQAWGWILILSWMGTLLFAGLLYARFKFISLVPLAVGFALALIAAPFADFPPLHFNGGFGFPTLFSGALAAGLWGVFVLSLMTGIHHRPLGSFLVLPAAMFATGLAFLSDVPTFILAAPAAAGIFILFQIGKGMAHERG